MIRASLFFCTTDSFRENIWSLSCHTYKNMCFEDHITIHLHDAVNGTENSEIVLHFIMFLLCHLCKKQVIGAKQCLVILVEIVLFYLLTLPLVHSS